MLRQNIHLHNEQKLVRMVLIAKGGWKHINHYIIIAAFISLMWKVRRRLPTTSLSKKAIIANIELAGYIDSREISHV